MSKTLTRTIIGIVAATMGLVVGASADFFFEDFEGGSDGTEITAAPYTFANTGGGSSFQVRDENAQLVDPDGLATCGHCSDWGVGHQYTKNFGAIPSSGISVFSFKAYAQTASNGGNSSHWSTIGLRASTGSTFMEGLNFNVRDVGTDGGQTWWNIDARHVADGGSNYWAFPAGRFFEEIITGTLNVDRDNNLAWGTLTDSVGTVTSPTFPIVINGDLDEIVTGHLMFNVDGGYGAADPADFDDLRVVPEPGSILLVALGALGLISRIRRR